MEGGYISFTAFWMGGASQSTFDVDAPVISIIAINTGMMFANVNSNEMDTDINSGQMFVNVREN